MGKTPRMFTTWSCIASKNRFSNWCWPKLATTRAGPPTQISLASLFSLRSDAFLSKRCPWRTSSACMEIETGRKGTNSTLNKTAVPTNHHSVPRLNTKPRPRFAPRVQRGLTSSLPKRVRTGVREKSCKVFALSEPVIAQVAAVPHPFPLPLVEGRRLAAALATTNAHPPRLVDCHCGEPFHGFISLFEI